MRTVMLSLDPSILSHTRVLPVMNRFKCYQPTQTMFSRIIIRKNNSKPMMLMCEEVCIKVCACVCISVCVFIKDRRGNHYWDVHRHITKNIHTNTHAHTNIHIIVYIHTNTHTHIHIHIIVYIHTHTQYVISDGRLHGRLCKRGLIPKAGDECCCSLCFRIGKWMLQNC